MFLILNNIGQIILQSTDYVQTEIVPWFIYDSSSAVTQSTKKYNSLLSREKKTWVSHHIFILLHALM